MAYPQNCRTSQQPSPREMRFLRLVAANIALRESTAWSSSASPRFDYFAEKLLGGWTSDSCTQDVSEVVRSCGGAVQGLREVQLPGDSEGRGGTYLNRSNDSFLFWNDGSYSFGPMTQSNSGFWLTSLQWTKDLRIVLMTREEDGTALSTALHRKDERKAELELVHDTPEVDWTSEVRCRMGSSSQPWILQRAKWEMSGHALDLVKDAGSSPLGVWLDRSNDEYSVGVYCTKTHRAVSITRCYQPTGTNLEQIVYRQGSILLQDIEDYQAT